MSLLLVPGSVKRIGQAAKLKLLGVGFLVVVALLLGLTVALYNKAFTPISLVKLQTDSIGNQLNLSSDVKLRGTLVGEVKKIQSNGANATITLALKPNTLTQIPANVQARILPKTLFGEKFVDLVIPPQPAAQHITDGGLIPQDRSFTAIETGKLFDDVLPFLRTLQPEKVNETLNALATAVEGRGNQIGDNLSLANDYFTRFNTDIPNLQADISGLADLATSYGNAAPDLLTLLRNTAFTQRTIVQKQQTFADFLRGTAGFANTASDVLSENSSRLIQLAAVSRPTLSTLAFYSPELPCLLHGLTKFEPRLEGVFASAQGPFLHIRLETLPAQPQAYRPGVDAPTFGSTAAPTCISVPDGLTGKAGNAPNPPGTKAAYTAPATPGSSGLVGSPEEKSAVAQVVSPLLQQPPDAISDTTQLLVAPMLRGNEVSLG